MNNQHSHYASFSSVLLLPPSKAQVSPSVPDSPPPSAYVLLFTSQTTFHIHIQEKDKLNSVHFIREINHKHKTEEKTSQLKHSLQTGTPQC